MSSRLRLVRLRSALAGPFDLAIEAGECLAITGSSGSGKTLFLRMVADLDPSEGEVWLNGVERRAMNAPAWRRRVAYGAAEPGWWRELAVDHFDTSGRDFARAMLPRLNLAPDLLDSPLLRLSTGERQRLALVRTLALQPAVLLLDEPTGALDADSTQRVEAILRECLAEGASIVMVTHSPEQASRLGDRRMCMMGRRLVAS